MILVNTPTLPGHRVVEARGIVQGNTVRTKHLGRDIAAGLKNLVGGELRGYTELLHEARREALDRMISQARELGANAVLNVRLSTSSVMGGAAELYAYGTAVIVTPDHPAHDAPSAPAYPSDSSTPSGPANAASGGSAEGEGG